VCSRTWHSASCSHPTATGSHAGQSSRVRVWSFLRWGLSCPTRCACTVMPARWVATKLRLLKPCITSSRCDCCSAGVQCAGPRDEPCRRILLDQLQASPCPATATLSKSLAVMFAASQPMTATPLMRCSGSLQPIDAIAILRCAVLAGLAAGASHRMHRAVGIRRVPWNRHCGT